MKHILIISALVVGSIVLLSKDKVSALLKQYENTLNSLKIGLGSISNIDISDSVLSADIALSINNPTRLGVGADTGGYIKFKKLQLFTESGQYIGEAKPNISALTLPANTTTLTSKTPLTIPLNGNIVNLGIELFTNSKNLQVKADVEAFGKVFTF